MLVAYVSAGLDPARFWRITPRLYVAEMNGAMKRIKRERGLAWEAAMLGRMKEPPTYDDFVGSEAKKPRPANELGLWLRAANRGMPVVSMGDWKRGVR